MPISLSMNEPSDVNQPKASGRLKSTSRVLLEPEALADLLWLTRLAPQAQLVLFKSPLAQMGYLPCDRSSLPELHSTLSMMQNLTLTRQAISQHLEVLESAGLLSTKREGRYKYHYLITAPLETIVQRWLAPLSPFAADLIEQEKDNKYQKKYRTLWTKKSNGATR